LAQNNIPDEFVLEQNFPNPFNPITNISYSIPSEGKVELIVYDILGGNVQTIVNEIQSSGKHIVTFNGNELSSGVYFYRLNYDGHSTVKKMMMLK
ncbi:MAG: T9SS type A sorting domain-containing protein, partial [Ignavibacteriaceae bacterium]|nr:T9SS type A sorting domain-containing protein [Ignavibacteriaceae bacterium]